MMVGVYNVVMRPVGSIQALPSASTLFGALCWTLRLKHGNSYLVEFLNEIAERGGFGLSSAFWAVQNGNKISRAYPRPLQKQVRVDCKDRNSYRSQKNFRKLQFVSEGVLNKISQGQTLTHDSTYIKKDRAKHDVLYLQCEPEFDDLKLVLYPRQRVAIGSNETELFATRQILCGERVRVHFFVLTSDQWRYDVREAIHMMTERGIGGDRSVGMGQYEVESMTNHSLPECGSRFMTLSPYIPTPGEIKWLDYRNHYQVKVVRPAVESAQEFSGQDIWKRRITYIKEGSVLVPEQRKDIYGRLPVVKEIGDAKVRHHGYAIPFYLGGDRE